MAIFGDSDIPTMLTDWGNTITVDSVDGACALDHREEDEALRQDGAAGQITSHLVATIRTSDFPAIRDGDEVSIDGVNYTVWRALKMGDGGTTELWLRLT